MKKFFAVFLLILAIFCASVTGTVAKKSKKPNYKNGDFSNNIIISEIFPRAKKDDRHNEWIELHNMGTTHINLGNWQLDDEEDGSKPYRFSDKTIIKAGGFLVVTAKESKLSLGNQHDQVRLFNPKGELMDSVEYDQAPVQKSYARIAIDKEDAPIKRNNGLALSPLQRDPAMAGQQLGLEDRSNTERWLFDKHITPGEKNPRYHEIIGTVKEEPIFAENNYFIFENRSKKQIKITFTEDFMPGPLAKVTFTKDAKATLLIASYTKNNAEIFELKKYEITSNPKIKKTNHSSMIVIVGIVFIMLASITFVVIFKK